jgi:hypothetical protein
VTEKEKLERGIQNLKEKKHGSLRSPAREELERVTKESEIRQWVKMIDREYPLDRLSKEAIGILHRHMQATIKFLQAQQDEES